MMHDGGPRAQVCKPGRYQPIKNRPQGQNTASDCLDCPVGKYQTEPKQVKVPCTAALSQVLPAPPSRFISGLP